MFLFEIFTVTTITATRKGRSTVQRSHFVNKVQVKKAPRHGGMSGTSGEGSVAKHLKTLKYLDIKSVDPIIL